MRSNPPGWKRPAYILRLARFMITSRRIVAVTLALAVLGGLAACGSDDEGTTAGTAAGTTETATATAEQTTGTIPAGPTIVVRDGQPVGGVRDLEFSSGERAYFWVQSSEAVRVHVHGYDLYGKVPAGGTFLFGFDADIQGVFEVELEDRAVQIAELRVNP